MAAVTLREYYQQHQRVQALLGPGDFRLALLGAHHEIGEALDHLPWRPWRVTDHRTPTGIEVMRAVPELCDSIGALTRAMVNLGVSDQDYEYFMKLHVQTKFDRIEHGIDQLQEEK